MEASVSALQINTHPRTTLLSPLPSRSTAFISALHRLLRRSHGHAGDCPDLTMRLGSDLTLQRISSTTQCNFRSNRRLDNHRKMEEQFTNKDFEISKSGDGQDKGQKLATPPSPEKPLPGDCCGSGCVWDVYYEELDEYNKLYNNAET